MATTNVKMPPVLESEDAYIEWINDLKIWQLFTDLPKAKQGPAVYLSLTGRARECVRDLTPAQISAETGVANITAKLDAIFKKDHNTRAYMAFKEFYDFKRSSGVSITDFIVRFEYLYHKLQGFDMKLPEGVKAFFLLNAANVSEDNEKLARATVGDLTYDNMKSKMQKIFGDPNANDILVSCKVEPVYYASGKKGSHWRGRGGRDRGQGRAARSSNYVKTDSNPIGADGKPMKCFSCESIKHLSRDCPHKLHEARSSRSISKPNDIEQVNITLYGSGYDEEAPKGVIESFGMALLDSGCTRTVTGKSWLNAYIESLPDNDKQSVKYSEDKSKFRFGDGKEVMSEATVQIPAYLARQRVMINTSLVENRIPLLLSRQAMKQAGMTVDFDTDTAMVLGCKVKLVTSSSGHYCLPITKCILGNDLPTSIVLHATEIKQLTYQEKRIKALKLHRQLSHASKDKLKKLAQESQSFDDPEFLKAIEESCEACEICETFRKPPLKPVVGLRLADEFNQVVCLDLKEFHHKEFSWILHLIDASTRYSAACLVKTKMQEEIVRKIFNNWIAYFGAPQKMLTDNGGEFANETFREMNEKLNVCSDTTAAESPWSNGIVERHNAILYESMMKTINDTHCDPEIALAWAVSAKNTLQNNAGYSPNQLVFGRNVNLPSVLNNEMPALESFTKSDIVRMNLDAMHKARENFIRAESSERIRRALRHKVRSYSDQKYENGQQVFYKRKDTKGWKGPGVVLGQDGQYVLIRHASAYYRVHPCQLMKKRNPCATEPEIKECHDGNTALSPDSADREEQNDDTDSEIDNAYKSTASVLPHETSTEQTTLQSNGQPQMANNSLSHLTDGRGSACKPRRNAFIKFKMKDEHEWQKAKVLSYQPKQTGKYRDWVNVKSDFDAEPKCINWDDVESWINVADESVVYLSAAQTQSQEVVDAKDIELENMRKNKVYEIVPYDNQTPVITARWIITEKVKEDKTKVKARLVARGFEEDSEQLKKDSPTCTRESLRLLFLTASLMKWEINTLDITAAFLQGNDIQRELYLQPPRDACPKGYLWKLKRCIYGLTDAPRAWYDKVKETLCMLGAKVSRYDSSLFLFHEKQGVLSGIMAVHVDDFAYCGNSTFHQTVIEEIKKRFSISKVESGIFNYVGLQVAQRREGITVNQDLYINTIEPLPWTSSRREQKTADLTSDEKKQLKRLGGQMLWVASQTRPDLSFETCVMTNIGKQSTVRAIHDANKAISKLKSQSIGITFPSVESTDGMQVKAFSDATYASLDDGSSQGGHIIFIEGINKKSVPISWQSKKLNRVTKSPLASETLALAEAADAAYLVAKMVQEIFQLTNTPDIECFTDNASLSETLKTSTTVSDKRLRVDIARLREMVDRKEIKVTWVEGTKQLADCLTKRGASSQRLLEVLGRNELF